MINSARNFLSLQMCDLLFTQSADPIFVLEIGRNFVEVNRAACDHTGYSRDELLKMGPQDIDDVSSKEKIATRFEKLLKEGEATFDAVHIRRDGTHISVEMHIKMFEYEGKKFALNICRDISNRVNKDFEYRTIVQTSTDGFWISNITDGRILDVNNAFCRMVGYTQEELLSMRITDLEANETPKETEAHMRRIIEVGHDFFETLHRRKDGQLIELEINVSFSTIRGGVLYVFARDISERKRFLRELLRFKEENKELYCNAPCGYHSVDADGRILNINYTEARWLGYTPNELIGTNIRDIHSNISKESFDEKFSCFKLQGDISGVEVELICKDGKTIQFLQSSKAEYDREGNFVQSHTTMIDITERKLRDKALQLSEDRFRLLFEKAPIGISMAGDDLKIFAANAAFCKLFGYLPEELSNMTIADLTHPDYIESTQEIKSSMVRGMIPVYKYEKKYVRKDGGIFWGRVTACGIGSLDPDSHYILGIVEDVSGRVEEEEYRLNVIKEQRDVIVREVHHRIKNNLQGVMGLIQQYASDHPELAGLTNIIIGRIYAIATIHGMQAQSMSENVELDKLLLNIIEASAGKTAEYHNILPCVVWLSRNEAVPIALVLNEIITNAVKYRCNGSTIVIRVEKSNDSIVLSITNCFSDSQTANPEEGHGLSLVNSMLPKKSAKLTVMRSEKQYSVELMLSSPVVMLNQDDIQ